MINYIVKNKYFWYNMISFYVDLLDIAGCIARLDGIAYICSRNIGRYKHS